MSHTGLLDDIPPTNGFMFVYFFSLSQNVYKAEGKSYHFMPFLLASTLLNETMDTR